MIQWELEGLSSKPCSASCQQILEDMKHSYCVLPLGQMLFSRIWSYITLCVTFVD